MTMDSERIVIGVDGGGTKTEAVLFGEERGVIAQGLFSTTNPHTISKGALRETLGSMFETLKLQAHAAMEEVDGVCMGMAGCDRPDDRAYLEEIVRESIGPSKPLLIVNDAVVALVGAMHKLHGLLLIAGTGSICSGHNERTGKAGRTGGFGHLLADEGSGYSIGIRALRAVMQESDGRGAKTSITERVLAKLNLESPEKLIGWVYMEGNGKSEIAALARCVHESDAAGDAVAARILDEEADELARLIGPTFAKVFDDNPVEREPLVLWGGNLVAVERYRQRLIDRVEKSNLPLFPMVGEERAVIGAARHMLNSL